MLNEFSQVVFKKKLYKNLEELQMDVGVWVRPYNEERCHSGKDCYGMTPMQAFWEPIYFAREKRR